LPWIDDVNARGGIHGRKVIMKEVDNQTTAEGAVAACKEETGNGSLFAVLQSNFSSEADCVDKAGMPTLVLGGSEIVSKWRHVHVLTLGKDGATNAASFLKNSLGDGAKKIGLIYVKNAFDGERIKNAFVARTKALGVNVVDAEPIQQNQASFVGELQNLRAKGAETVVIYAVLEVLGILRDARALNYAPHWIGITWTVDTLSKAARNVMDGIHGVRLYATVNSPAYKSYLAMAQKYGQGNNADSSGMYWYGVGLLLDKVLRAAGPDLNRTTFNAAFDKIQNYSNNILAPLSWSRGQALGTRASWPVVCCNPDYTWKGFGRASTFG
jgi:branched-chain amino acid transport system substrate-binding protein